MILNKHYITTKITIKVLDKPRLANKVINNFRKKTVFTSNLRATAKKHPLPIYLRKGTRSFRVELGEGGYGYIFNGEYLPCAILGLILFPTT